MAINKDNITDVDGIDIANMQSSTNSSVSNPPLMQSPAEEGVVYKGVGASNKNNEDVFNTNPLGSTGKSSIVEGINLEQQADLQEFGSNIGSIPQSVIDQAGSSYMNHLMPGSEAWKRATVQGSYNFVSGVAMAASAWDLPDSAGLLVGAEQEYTNDLYNWGKEVAAEGQAGNTIYQKSNDGGIHLTEGAWWGQFGADMGTTVGFVAETAFESLLLGALTGGLGAGAVAGKAALTVERINLLRKLAQAGKLTKALKNAGTFTKAKAINSTFGLLKGFQEGQTESYEAFSSTKKKFLDLGKTEEESTRLASIAANTTFQNGVLPLMIINAIQWKSLAHVPGSKATKKLSDNWGTSALKGVKSYGETVVSESLEEGIQNIASLKGTYKSDREAGISKLGQGDFLTYLSDPTTFHAMVAGGFGGVAMKGLGGIPNIIPDIKYKRHWSNKHKTFLGTHKKRSVEFLAKIHEAETSGNYPLVESLKEEFSRFTALSSLELDRKTERTSGYESHITFLKDTLKAVEVGDKEEIAKLDLSKEDQEYIKKTFPSMVADAELTKKIYDEVSIDQEDNIDSVAVLTEAEMMIRTETKKIVALEKELSDKDIERSSLSSEGDQLLTLNEEIESIDSEIKDAKERLTEENNEKKVETTRGFIEARKADKINRLADKKELKYTEEDKEIVSSLNSKGRIKILNKLKSAKRSRSKARASKAAFKTSKGAKNRLGDDATTIKNIKDATTNEGLTEVVAVAISEGKMTRVVEDAYRSKLSDLHLDSIKPDSVVEEEAKTVEEEAYEAAKTSPSEHDVDDNTPIAGAVDFKDKIKDVVNLISVDQQEKELEEIQERENKRVEEEDKRLAKVKEAAVKAAYDLAQSKKHPSKRSNIHSNPNPTEQSVGVEVTEKMWKTFIDTGKIPQDKVNDIANKIKKGITPSDKELAMRTSYSKEIEEILKKPTPQTSEVDSKKADIEKRRQEELDEIEQIGEEQYHGTAIEFNEWDDSFRGTGTGNRYGQGFYFTNNETVAKEYAETNAVDWVLNEETGEMEEVQGKTWLKKVKIFSRNPISSTSKEYKDLKNKIENESNSAEESNKKLTEELLSRGYDVITDIKGEDNDVYTVALTSESINTEDKINAKYDAELAALDTKPTPQTSEVEDAQLKDKIKTLTSNPKGIKKVESNGDRYYEDNEGNRYVGVSNIVNPSDFKDEKGDWTGSAPIGTAVDEFLREYFMGNTPEYKGELAKRLTKEAFDQLVESTNSFKDKFRVDGSLSHIEFLTEGLFIADKNIKATKDQVEEATKGSKKGRNLDYGIATEMDMVVVDKNTGKIHLIDFKTVRVDPKKNQYGTINPQTVQSKLTSSFKGSKTKKEGYSKQQNATSIILEGNEGIVFNSMSLLTIETRYEPKGQQTTVAKMSNELVPLKKETIDEVFPSSYSSQINNNNTLKSQPAQQASEVKDEVSTQKELLIDNIVPYNGSWMTSLASKDGKEFLYDLEADSEEELLALIEEATSQPLPKKDKTVNNFDEVSESSREVVESYTPLTLNNPTQEHRELMAKAVKDYYEMTIKQSLNGTPPTFDQAIKRYLKVEKIDVVEEVFNLIKEGWKDNNYPGNEEEFNASYDVNFNSIDAKALSMTSIFNRVIQEAGTKTEGIAPAVENGVSTSSVPTRGITSPTGKQTTQRRVNKTDGKKHRAGLLGIELKTIQEDENGVISSKEVSVQDKLNGKTEVNLNIVLDPSQLNAGTVLDVTLKSDYNNTLVSDYEKGVKQDKGITFREWVDKYEIEPDSDEWLAKVPMVAKQGDDTVFFIHDNDWFTYDRMEGIDHEEKLGNMSLAKENNLTLRKSIYSGETKVKITSKESGGFEKTQTKETVAKMAPNAQIVVAGDAGSITPNIKGVVNSQLTPGRSYQVREGVNKGEKILHNITPSKLSDTTFKSIQSLIYLYLHHAEQKPGRPDNKDIQEKNKDTVKKLLAKNIDITNPISMGEYLSQHIFMSSFNEKGMTVKKAISKLENSSNIPVNAVVFGMEKGRIYCGVKRKNGKMDYRISTPYYLGENIEKRPAAEADDVEGKRFVTPKEFLQFLAAQKNSIRQNVSKDSLGYNTDNKMVMLSPTKNGIKIEELETNYEHHIKENSTTDIKSYTIQTKSNGKIVPKEITIVQPIIEFEMVEEAVKPVDYFRVEPKKVDPVQQPTEVSDKELEVEYGDTYIDFVSLRNEGEILEVDC